MSVFIFPPIVATVDTGFLATAEKQDDQTALLTTIDADTSILAGTDFATQTTLATLLTDVQLRASPVPVSGPLTDTELRATAVPVSGPLTDTELRATAVPVSGPLTNTELRATAVPVSGPLTDTELRATAVPVSGPLTDTELRATAVPVSGPLTDAELRATAVPVSGPLTDTELRATAVPVSVSSLPLPSGAATESTLSSILSNTSRLSPVDQIDTTPLLDTSIANIPASGSNPVEVVASLAADVHKVISVEDIGEFIGLYTGAALSETLHCILPLGGGEVEVNLASGTRISLRNMKNATISSGFIALNFLG